MVTSQLSGGSLGLGTWACGGVSTCRLGSHGERANATCRVKQVLPDNGVAAGGVCRAAPWVCSSSQGLGSAPANRQASVASGRASSVMC